RPVGDGVKRRAHDADLKEMVVIRSPSPQLVPFKLHRFGQQRRPWVNHIERLWHKLHETITRNHQCRGMANLLARVKHFMDTVSPFPGNGYGTAKV
ncbi:hypothetical protein ACLHZ5_21595, partial [Aeromonas media]